jgi:hypothetical protein
MYLVKILSKDKHCEGGNKKGQPLLKRPALIEEKLKLLFNET